MGDGSTHPHAKPDVAANRRARKWTPSELLARALWDCARIPLFVLIPRQLWPLRTLVLRAFRARIGRNVHVHPSVRIFAPWNLQIGDNSAIGESVILYNLGPIIIGDDVTISQYAHLCAGTHAYRRADMQLIKSPITIGSGAWICADAFIGPGVTVGAMAIVGARCVATKDITPGDIMAGNPARSIGVRQ